MSMKFTPKTEKQINDERLMPEGEYPFEISGAESKKSKAGNDMIEIMIRVYKPDGTFNLVTDYLLESMLHKLLHCCEACGLQDQYAQGILDADMFIGKTGMLKLKVDPEKGDFPAKNSVKDYIKDAKAEIPKDELEKALPPKDDDMSDDIPF